MKFVMLPILPSIATDLWLWCGVTGTGGKMNSSSWSETMGAKNAKEDRMNTKQLAEEKLDWSVPLRLEATVYFCRSSDGQRRKPALLASSTSTWSSGSGPFPPGISPGNLCRYLDVPVPLPLLVLRLFPGLSCITGVNAAKSLQCWTPHHSGLWTQLCGHSCGWGWHLVLWRLKISKQENYQGVTCWEIRWENETAIDQGWL